MSLPQLKRYLVVLPCPLSIAKSSVSYKTLWPCFCHSITHSFHKHWSSTSVCQALCGVLGPRGRGSLSSGCTWLSFAFSSHAEISLCPCAPGFHLVPSHLCAVSLHFLPLQQWWAPFILPNPSQLSPCGDFYIFVGNHSTLYTMGNNAFIGRLWGGNLEEQRQGSSEGSK